MVSTEVIVGTSVLGIEPAHPAAQAATGELQADLASVPELRMRERDARGDGSKGAPVDLLVSLSTSGGIAALVRIVRLWLGRDRRRKLTLSVHDTADGRAITIEGENVSVASLTDALNSAVHTDLKTKSNSKMSTENMLHCK